ncbi:MAG: CaiB/BaiF CoA transferase family protein [Candidatus Nanopelagicales bacterium]
MPSAAARDASSAPLAGIVVVGLEQAVAAPFATRQLADLGAFVLKVEPPGGDFARHYDSAMAGQSASFVWVNRGKQSVALDLRLDDDRATLAMLIAGADVFVHNVSPGAAARLGIDPGDLLARHPALIACAISGYGSDGPRSADKAYDLAIQAEAGAFSVTGAEEMSKVGFPVADIAAGMYALSSILAALVRRGRTGEGAAIRVAMIDALVEWMSAPLYAAAYGEGQAPRAGRRHHSIAPYGTFRLSDGRTVLIAVQNDPEWGRLAAGLLDRPGLADDPRYATNPARIAHVDEVESMVADALASLGADDALGRLAGARIAVAYVNDLPGVWEHEELRSRGLFRSAGTQAGPVEVLDVPFDISGWRPGPGRVPGLDEHDQHAIDGIIARGRRS